MLKPGAQGGSVVNSLLATGHYRIRGLTRNPNSNKAKALAAKGVEVVKCDLAVKEDVKKALKDADIAWIVTNFWDPVSIFFFAQVYMYCTVINYEKFLMILYKFSLSFLTILLKRKDRVK